MFDWLSFQGMEELPSPTLVLYLERVRENLRRAIRQAGGPDRLRPHLKTHKMSELVRLNLRAGISRFKCATIAEAEMAAAAGAIDVLIAYSLVGPNIARFVKLATRYPGTKFSAVADDADNVRRVSAAASTAGLTIELLLDLDIGMHRTGVPPGPAAFEVYKLIATLPGLSPGGVHAYDGQIRNVDPAARRAASDAAFALAHSFLAELRAARLSAPRLIVGGSPTFPAHALREDVECSPGTFLLWDSGYGERFPDVDYLPAAALLTRVVSKPGGSRLTFDLGTKAVASDTPQPRVELAGIPITAVAWHGEEHLTIETEVADAWRVGQIAFAIPKHVCPTIALYPEAVIVDDGREVARWEVTARDRVLSI